jgi:hypothetical protein
MRNLSNKFFDGCLTLVALHIVAASLLAQEANPVKAEDDAALLDTVLSWLPTDTENVAVAWKFELPLKASNQPPVSEVDFVVSVLRSVAGGPVEYLKKGTYADELRRIPIVLAVGAGREFDVTNEFGELRYQGCHILIFKNSLERTLGAFDARVRSDCKESRKIDGVETFVFDDDVFTKESPASKKEWETLLIARPENNIVICATQENFLKDVLRRRTVPSPGRAVPNDLPIWKYIDRASPAWMLRHERKSSDKTLRSTDIATAVRPEAPAALRVAYVADGPKARQIALRSAQKRWGADVGVLQKLNPAIEQDDSGAAKVSIPIDATPREMLSERMASLLFVVPMLRSSRFEE